MLTAKEKELNKLENYDDTLCPHCASAEVWYNSCGELQCENCGYTEEKEEGEGEN